LSIRQVFFLAFISEVIMATIIDVSSTCGAKAADLAAAGVKCVIRYYSRDTIRPSKRIDRSEAMALTAAGLRLAIVHEGRYGDKADNYERATGLADAQYVLDYASATLQQPKGSAIYFGIDFDASAAEIHDRILPYFQAIADVFGQAGNPYKVGVYGSGATCKALLDAGLARYAWLAQSTGWTGYKAFLASNRWALRQDMPASVGGVACDPDVAGADGDFGDFSLAATPAGAPASAPVRQAMRVNARGGLRLRSGPGTDFDSLRLLPLDTLVYPLKASGSWTQVDLEGDGRADGFVSGAYLVEADGAARATAALMGAPFTLPAAPPRSADAVHVPELIRQGTTADGLKQARQQAAAALPGYPHNGCAAHLSALLRQAGIDVPMTIGAGKLAHVIEQRGWRQVAVGQQTPGDIGVCFDNDPNPPGSDHVYLVVETHGTDEMVVADNQRTTDAPHTRFASGKGKTPTEYFLRA
jgi:hypothetical protein